MRTLVLLCLIMISTTVTAQHRHHGHHHRSHNQWHWVAPAIIGGTIVYGMTRPTMPPPSVYYLQQPHGFPPAPYGYYYVQMLDGNCNCYRWVLIPS